VAELLQRSFRSDDVVARWGGEEFLVGMYGMTKADAPRRMRQVLRAFRADRFSDGGGPRFRVSFSAGVAQYPPDGTDLQNLCRAADGALYGAKAAGRARVLPA
jgi:diguanylate cyclase (GGDEF)-like protein